MVGTQGVGIQKNRDWEVYGKREKMGCKSVIPKVVGSRRNSTQHCVTICNQLQLSKYSLNHSRIDSDVAFPSVSTLQ